MKLTKLGISLIVLLMMSISYSSCAQIDDPVLSHKTYPFTTPKKELIGKIKYKILSEFPEVMKGTGIKLYGYWGEVDSTGKIIELEYNDWNTKNNKELADYLLKLFKSEEYLQCYFCAEHNITPKTWSITLSIEPDGIKLDHAFYLD